MLDAYIIDAIRREERAQLEQPRARLELPRDPYDGHRHERDETPAAPGSTVIIIPLHDVDEDAAEDEAA